MVGAFAFTLSVPLILLGNGIGAIVVRQLTIYNLEKIKRYVYLKNGAMYSVLVLGFVMLAHGYRHPHPGLGGPAGHHRHRRVLFLEVLEARRGGRPLTACGIPELKRPWVSWTQRR